MLRRHLLAAASAAALVPISGRAGAEAFPTKPVKLIVPFPPGGITDAMLRMLAEGLRASWQQSVVIENKPGAGTIIGTDAVAKSEPDGHTMGLVVAAHTANPSLHKKLPYDTFKDLAGITMLAKSPVALYASNDVPVRGIQEFIQYARKNPGLGYGSVGAGSQTHIAGEAFRMASGIDIRHVAYKGSAPAQNDLMGGHLKLLFDALPSGIELVKSGKFKLVAIGSPERHPLVPEVSTFAEAVPGFQSEALFGLVLPSATPRPVVDKIYADVLQALKQPQLQEWFRTRGFVSAPMSPRDFDAFILADYKRWNEVIVKGNITLN